VRYEALQLVTETGGSEILGYNLQMDDGIGGAFVSLYGSSSDDINLNTMVLYHTVEKGLIRGRRYGFRYRARNHYGWSDQYSPVTYILAIERPQVAPKDPQLSSASDNQITLILSLCPDDGSTPILKYELWMSDGLETSTYAQVSSYLVNSFEMTHTLQTGVDPIVSGNIYGFKWRCYNLMGYSDWSETFYAAAAEVPAKPSTPVIDYQWSDNSTIFV
jgi:hypothetical protein